MATGILSSLNQVINATAKEILDSKVIENATGVFEKFLVSGVEAIKTLTEEQQQNP